MKFQAVIFDVYRTLMRIRPAEGEAEPRWRTRCLPLLPQEAAALTLESFNQTCRAEVASHHQAAHARGIRHPEVFWPDVMAAVVPGWDGLDDDARLRFQIDHLAAQRVLDLMPGAGEVLQTLVRAGIPLGIASNAQPYTLDEFASVLKPAGLDLAMFSDDLIFWSWTHGFSKPDPHVFRILTFRLRARRIDPSQVLMVGDRVDNDVQTAQAFGWQTWHFRESGDGPEPGGTMAELGRFLAG